jgi:hypothetical protein
MTSNPEVVVECLNGIKEIIDCYIEYVNIPLLDQQKHDIDDMFCDVMSPLTIQSLIEDLKTFEYSETEDPIQVIFEMLRRPTLFNIFNGRMDEIRLVLEQALSMHLFREPAILILSKLFGT